MKEHLRSQIEDADGSPKLTKKEIELLRFTRDSSIGWDDLLDAEE